MTRVESAGTAPACGALAVSNLFLPPGFAAALLQVQLMQIEALVSWQRSLLAANQELWDQWAARFGGGVPIGA